MNFATNIQKLADMLSLQVEVLSQPAAGVAGTVKVATQEGSELFAQALSRSGIAAQAISRRGRHIVYVG